MLVSIKARSLNRKWGCLSQQILTRRLFLGTALQLELLPSTKTEVAASAALGHIQWVDDKAGFAHTQTHLHTVHEVCQ